MDVRKVNVLPIVQRELLVASRRHATYWSRFAAAAIAIVLGTWICLTESGAFIPPHLLGSELFCWLAGFVFLFILIVGTRVTSDCLCDEKREGTLGFLFLTDLKSYDVIMGKLAASSLNVIYSILAVVPILAIPLLLGGVSNSEFWRVVMTAFNLLFLCLTVGIFASAFCETDIKASGLAIVILVVLLTATPLLAFILSINYGSPVDFNFMIGSPAYDCIAAFDSNFSTYTKQFWWNAIVTHVLAWLFFFCACRTISRAWKDRGESPPRLLNALNAFKSEPAKLLARRASMLEIAPYYWRCYRSNSKQFFMWAGIGILFFLWLVIQIFIHDTDTQYLSGYLAVLCAHLMLKNWVATQASCHLCEDRRSGALELLLSTPLTPKEIIHGQIMALFQQFRRPIITVFILDLIWLYQPFKMVSDREFTFCFMVIAMFFLIIDTLALAWVGMWQGITSRNTGRAITWALLKIILIPSLLSIIIMTLHSVLGQPQNPGTEFIIVWILIGIVTNLIFGGIARTKLKDFFTIKIQNPGKHTA